jgi:hypothetical protein
MNAHPDIAATAAAGVHEERLAAARTARLIRAAERLNPKPPMRQRLTERTLRSIAPRRNSVPQQIPANA